MKQFAQFAPFISARVGIPTLFHTIPGYYYDTHIQKFADLLDYEFANIWCDDLEHRIKVTTTRPICFLIKRATFSPQHCRLLDRLVIERRLQGYELTDKDIIFIHVQDISRRYINFQYPATLVSHCAIYPMFQYLYFYENLPWNEFPALDQTAYESCVSHEQLIASHFGQRLFLPSNSELNDILATLFFQNMQASSFNILNTINAARNFYQPFPSPTSLSNLAKTLAACSASHIRLQPSEIEWLASIFLGRYFGHAYQIFRQEMEESDPVVKLQNYNFSEYSSLDFSYLLQHALNNVISNKDVNKLKQVIHSLVMLFSYDPPLAAYGLMFLGKYDWAEDALSSVKLTKEMRTFLEKYDQTADLNIRPMGERRTSTAVKVVPSKRKPKVRRII